MKIKVKYNGRRFPRVVSLRKGGMKSFHADRVVMELEEYDALFLLKSNTRMKPTRWEFTIVGVDREEKAEVPGGWASGEEPKEKAEKKPKEKKKEKASK